MATKGVSSQRKTNSRGPMVLLSAALCEWFLIFLLFVDATFSYLIRRFAEYCELPTPCLFCSRIDALSGKRKFEYNALLCRNHREEISSLVSCNIHGNLTDVSEMCEECFMSRHDKLNSGSYMMGKLDMDIEQHRVQNFLLHKKIALTSSFPRICPCCNRSWGAKPNTRKFLELPPVGFGASKANVKPPLPRVPGRSRFSRRNSFKKHRHRLSAPVSPRADGKSPSDAMSQVSYADLKFNSDAESEKPFLDIEGVFAVRGKNDTNLEHDPHYAARTQRKLQTDAALLEKQSNHAFAEVTSLLDQHVQLKNHKSLPTRGLEELNWEHMHRWTNRPVHPELLEDVIKAPSNESGDASLTVEPRSHMSSTAMLDDLIPLKNTPLGSDDKNQETLKSHDEGDMAVAQQPIRATGFSDNGVPYILEDISSINSNATTDEEKGESTTPVELPSTGGSINFEDIKSVLQQSAPNKDNSQDVGASNPDGNHVQDLNSLERDDSSLKSVGVSLTNDMAVAQQPINATGFLDGCVPYVEVDISSTNSSPARDDWKEVSTAPVELPYASRSINFEDIKSVLQPSPKSPDANHVRRLTSLERTDSRFIFERISSSDDMTLHQQQIMPPCFSDGGLPYILNDSCSTNSSMSDEGNEVSTTSFELPSVGGSPEFEDIKPVLQQSDPKQDDSQNVDASISDANQVEDLVSVERNDFSLKFEERVSLSDVEGEDSIDMLKSQIEHGKKCMNDLYKELEEERNAAAISANQAMAMITRLQEEKAALHMEALQYLRMMDEQAEYDMDALQKASDDLAEKEKELQDLEYELELYRNNDGRTAVPGPHRESISTTGDSCVHHNESCPCEPRSPVPSKMGKDYGISSNAKSSMLNLDEERVYLVEYLKQLERRIHEVSCSKPSVGSNEIDYQENPLTNDQESEKETDGSHMQNGFDVVSGTSPKVSSTHLIEDRNACSEDTNHNISNLQKLSTSGCEPNMASLENEIANLKERLQAFEADKEFIKHSLCALHNGNDGLQYIQQIIDQLQELRNREFKKDVYPYPKDESLQV